MITQAIFIVIFYLLATASLTLKTIRPDNTPAYAITIMRLFGGAALIAHGYIIYHMVFVAKGLNMGFFISLSLVGWTVALIVYVTSIYKSLQNLLIVLFPLSAFVLLMSLFVDEHRILTSQLTMGLKIHIILSIMAYSLLFIATLQSLFVRYQERLLFAKKANKVINILPPLQVMEHLLLQFIIIGFFMLSLSLASGMMFINDMFAQHLAHKTILSFIAWLIYGVLLCGHWLAGWRGKHITHWAVGGFITLLLAYVGTKFVLEFILNRI